jgi:hypothetical protein
VLPLPSVAESHLCLKPLNFKSVMVVLMSIPAISRHEAVKCRNEPALTGRVCEIEPLQISHKSVGSVHFKRLNLSAVVLVSSWVELIAGSMGHYLVLAGRSALLGAVGCRLVVVALNEEDEIGPALPHPVVKRLVICQSFEVEDEGADGTA